MYHKEADGIITLNFVPLSKLVIEDEEKYRFEWKPELVQSKGVQLIAGNVGVESVVVAGARLWAQRKIQNSECPWNAIALFCALFELRVPGS